MEPLIVVTEVASMAPSVVASRLMRVLAVVDLSMRVTATSSNPVIPDDA